MPHLDSSISDFAQGDSVTVPRTVIVTDILPDTLAKAWFTVKRKLIDADVDAVIQKSITPSVTESGQIDAIGAADADGHLSFILSADDTRKLAAGFRYFYDIKALSSTGSAKILEEGRICARAPVTRATS